VVFRAMSGFQIWIEAEDRGKKEMQWE